MLLTLDAALAQRGLLYLVCVCVCVCVCCVQATHVQLAQQTRHICTYGPSTVLAPKIFSVFLQRGIWVSQQSTQVLPLRVLHFSALVTH